VVPCSLVAHVHRTFCLILCDALTLCPIHLPYAHREMTEEEAYLSGKIQRRIKSIGPGERQGSVRGRKSRTQTAMFLSVQEPAICACTQPSSCASQSNTLPVA
jgi:hypothetical protein